MKRSFPRIFSSNFTNVSPSGNEVTVAFPSGTFMKSAILWASSRLALPEKICKRLPKIEAMLFYRIGSLRVEVGNPMLFANDLNKDPLISSAIELPIKNLLPWAEIESASLKRAW